MLSNFTPHDSCSRKGPGTLYVVATPIGNLDDMTFRAVETLKTVDVIAAEDTRHTGKLLSHFNIKKKLISLHEHNEAQRVDEIVSMLMDGVSVAAVSDAGTPSVSDPGYRIVTAAVEKGIPVVPVPGVSAAVTALSVSGLPTDSFTFIGFPPRKSGKRRELLTRHIENTASLIFYESPHRILSLLEDALQVLGDRQAVLAREMTKIHEEFVRGQMSAIIENLKERDSIKGECALIISGFEKTETEEISDGLLHLEIGAELDRGDLKPSVIARELAKKYNIPKKKVYDEIMKMKQS